MIARAVVQDTPVMVLDEPAAFLDIPNKYELVRILSNFRDQGKTILYSTHDLETALMCTDKFWVIDQGRINQGSPEDMGLSGLFDHLFEASGISFDNESGRFRYRASPKGTVSLGGGPDLALSWTRRTIERIGFEVTTGNEPIHIEVFSSEGGYIWQLEQNGIQKTVDNLYKLARFLTLDV